MHYKGKLRRKSCKYDADTPVSPVSGRPPGLGNLLTGQHLGIWGLLNIITVFDHKWEKESFGLVHMEGTTK